MRNGYFHRRAALRGACATGILLLAALSPAADPQSQEAVSGNGASVDWAAYGGNPENTHYSALTQINRANVKQLELAWTFDTGETGGLQSSPLIVNGVLFGITPSQKIFALDAQTGRLLWKFDSGLVGTQPDRGLAYWSSGSEARILVGVMNYLYALDPATGQPIPGFGEAGRIDLRKGLGRNFEEQSIALTSPGIVYRDLIIVGGRLPETLPAPPGDIRAYDVRTGELRWSFHTIPHPGEFGAETWPADAWKKSGGANNWAGMSLDVRRGVVYVPTGSTAFDFYGADRLGNNLFSDALIALDAATGKRLWHFQEVRHDIWDRDLPAPPVLVSVRRGGKVREAVAQTTKQGWVYLFDRSSGKPLFPVAYRPYPPSDLPGEVAARNQPLPMRPAPFARQRLTEEMLTTRTPEAHDWALRQFRTFRSAGQFVPFSLDKQTVVFPGFDGGGEWGGPAFDPESGILYVNANEMAWTGGLAPGPEDEEGQNGDYVTQCAVCHGEERKGSPPALPSLENLGARLSSPEIKNTIRQGKGRMPGFPSLTGDRLEELVRFLVAPPKPAAPRKEMASAPARTGAPAEYHFTGYRRFLDPEGYPAITPPWGTLNAIDLNTGKYAWKINLGEYPALAAEGAKHTGSENYGGPIVTAGGLVFIGATIFDKKFRAFDKQTGALLWERVLPFAAISTPATYAVRGRQFVVLAAGGGKDLKSPSGGLYMAFALPAVDAK